MLIHLAQFDDTAATGEDTISIDTQIIVDRIAVLFQRMAALIFLLENGPSLLQRYRPIILDVVLDNGRGTTREPTVMFDW